MSPSYVAGFDNHISVLTAVGASLTVFLWCWRFRRSLRDAPLADFGEPTPKIGFPAIAGVTVFYLLIFCILAFAAHSSPRYLSSDVRYFLEKAEEVSRYHRQPYVDFEYAYGPLLLFGPLFVQRLLLFWNVSLETSYYLFTAGIFVVGLYLPYTVIDRFLSRKLPKTLLFVAFTFCAINISFGPNGSNLRFLTPFAFLLYLASIEKWTRNWDAARAATACALYLGLTAWILFLISPDIGMVYACGTTAYSLYRVVDCSRWFALAFAGPVLGLAGALPFLGIHFLETLATFSSGAMNFVVVPTPHILVFLLFLIILVPSGLAAFLRSPNLYRGPLVGCYCCALALVPAALGRCDWPHVFSNGMGLFILGFAFLDRHSTVFQSAAIAAVGLLFALSLVGLIVVSAGPFVDVFYDWARTRFTEAQIEAASAGLGRRVRDHVTQVARTHLVALREVPDEAQGSIVATPWGTDKWTEAMLQRSGAYQPTFYTDFINAATPEAEKVKIASLREMNWVLIPNSPPIGELDLNYVRKIFLFPVSYRRKQEPYVPGRETLDYLRAHFQEAQRFPSYQLLERNAP